jgi:3-phenylpropionate/trans-cinnamate dioxygenase ferredoxin reductase subunit
MSSRDPFVIVGASLAGATAAQKLRAEGYAGALLLIGAEASAPYERPPLSKGYLAGSSDRDETLVAPKDWYAENDVELRTGTRVASVDADGHSVTLDGGEAVPYARLLLATGAEPRRLRLPGSDLEGVHYLRTVEDSEGLRSSLQGGGRRVVVIGGGWIGLEVAAAARGYDNSVTVLEPGEAPLHRALGPELGGYFGQLHRDHGVDLRVQTGAAELRGSGGRATAVVTTTGDVIEADVIVAGIGVVPRLELAESAGLDIDNGVLVGPDLRSSNPDILAAGDIANFLHPRLGRRLRVEHWANARTTGEVAAQVMLGREVTHDPVPYFFTDQYDLGMEYSGHATAGDYDRVVYRGEVASGEFIAFWMAGDRVVAGMNVNVWDVTDNIAALIRDRVAVDDDQLRDPGVPLDKLASPAP